MQRAVAAASRARLGVPAGVGRRAASSRPLVTPTVAALRAARAAAEAASWRERDRALTVGFVPTMGSLHDGHLSLVKAARERCDYVAASVFVNPAQFAPHEDLAAYTARTAELLARDIEALAAAGVDAVFAPTPDVVYPADVAFPPRVVMAGVDAVGEGAARPGFFDGVATVVSRLFNIVQPTHAFFGQKDGAQCVVVRQLARAMHFPVAVVVVPTVREADGLAMSSRNVNIKPEDRPRAPALYAALRAVDEAWRGEAGAVDADSDGIRGGAEASRMTADALRRVALERLGGFDIDYVSVAAASSGLEVAGDAPLHPSSAYLVSACVRLGGVRLLDNVVVGGRGLDALGAGEG
mmetsp:Transcript_5212/g.18747  ORF Transcript_5212/g.18747 Transcript_5212/m.18747 type:complete len:353 (-) Transcript_5212:97-1155(-)